MSTIDLFESKEQLLSFRDRVGTVLSEALSTRVKGRRLDELSARLLGAADFNTALGLVDRKENTSVQSMEPLTQALNLIWKSREYFKQHGKYPPEVVHLLNPGESIEDFFAEVSHRALAEGRSPKLDVSFFDSIYFRLPAKITVDNGSTLIHQVSNHLDKHLHPCHGLISLHAYSDERSWSVAPPRQCGAAYRNGWLVADRQAVEGVLSLAEEDAANHVQEAQIGGFRGRQSEQLRLLQRDIDNLLEHESTLGLYLSRPDDEADWRWGCNRGRRESVERWSSKEQALFDGMKCMGGFGFCNQNDFERIYATEGWFFDFFESDADGLVIQLMGSEPEDDTTPALTDEEAWEWVVAQAKLGSALHLRALEWLGEVSEKERQRIREHTGY
ncbi:hypothetical protein [Pseudomonas taiwanensis]|uniref:hypothetical protein n=1 Tax=Pseudomonas taiwanensis TaxID=470150 RepID=UPI0028E42515|nr:hypothetical protein [Pseudomonas taiwanensis]